MRSTFKMSKVLLKIKCSMLILCLVMVSINTSSLRAQEQDVDFIVLDISPAQEGAGIIGQPQTVVVTVTDERAVKYVTLHYRFGENGDFTSNQMKQVAATQFEATAVPQNNTETKFQYYVEAGDTEGNITFSGHAFSPKTWQLSSGSEESPDAKPQTQSSISPSVSDNPVTTQPIESKPESGFKYGSRTLYTVLGVLAAVVVVGVVSNGSDGGSSDGGTVTFTSTEPSQ